MPTRVVEQVADRKPPFTRDQIVPAGDLVRKWRANVEPRLREFPYVLVFSGAEPRTTVMAYEKFEEMWQRAEEAAELELKVEVLSRVLHTALTKQPLVSLADVVAKAGIAPEDIENAGDVELETE